MYKISLRGINEVYTIELPKKPVETPDGKHYEVVINRKDGVLDTVYRFDKINVISIKESK